MERVAWEGYMLQKKKALEKCPAQDESQRGRNLVRLLVHNINKQQMHKVGGQSPSYFKLLM